MSKKKLRVAVLYGGRSAEHEISCRSAENVINQLDKDLFDVVPIGIDHDGHWHLGEAVYKKSLINQKVKKNANENTWFSPSWVGKAVNTLNDSHKEGLAFDVIFPVLHGVSCEDGTLQGLLELAEVPYVGSGVLSSALGMDKNISKQLAQAAGILVPKFLHFKMLEWQRDAKKITQQILKDIGLPVFVKPINTGSSIGVNKVKDISNLERCITEAFQFDNKVIVEEALDIIELEVAVLQALPPQLDPIISMVGEIRPLKDEFYTYTAKYLDDDGAKLLYPAPIPQEKAEEARKIARKVFQLLDCEGMARVDLFLNKKNHQVYFNEINSLPGFTNISMYPKLMEASGIPTRQVLTQLIHLAILKYREKCNLKRSYKTELATI